MGGVYDDRLLLKATPSSEAMLSDALCETPCEGSKTEMLLVDFEDRSRLTQMVAPMLPELSASKKR